MPDRPPEMYQGDRPVLEGFDAGEWFYHRFDPAFPLHMGKIDPLHVQCPDLSSNRKALSEPWHVLYPRARFGDWGVLRFQADNIPETVSADEPGANVYQLRTEHAPEPNNYGHYETRAYLDGVKQRSNQLARAWTTVSSSCI